MVMRPRKPKVQGRARLPKVPAQPRTKYGLRVHLFLSHRVPIGHTMGMTGIQLNRIHHQAHPWGT